jgi:hypothetical protein
MSLEREVATLRAELEAIKRRLPSRVGRDQPEATVRMVLQASHGLAVKNPIRNNGTSWVKSQADTAANAVVGGVVIAVLSANAFIFATPGSYVAGLSGLTAGAVHYLDASTAGALTTTAPAIAVPIIHADTTGSGVLMSAWPGGGGAAPTEDGTVFASNSGGTAGEWVRDLDLGRNATSKAGKLRLLSPDAAGVGVEIDAALVPASSKKLTIREILICDSGVNKKMLVLASATYT